MLKDRRAKDLTAAPKRVLHLTAETSSQQGLAARTIFCLGARCLRNRAAFAKAERLSPSLRRKHEGKRPDANSTMQPASYLRNKITQDKEPSNAACIAGLFLFTMP
ncbi:hypothetical protein HMPREF1246_1050 [Acidaminococcus sp. BV3L6]|nr:hypothetical protein HMPREF1246_1050 [Acidaminococcus sp. BV3L6]